MRLFTHSLCRVTFSVGALILLGAVLWLCTAFKQSESTLAIRPVSSSVSLPDGFSVWHHLDANGIHFKSITPQNNGLVIKFESSDQSAAAKAVLDRTLPQGYIIAQQDDDSLTPAWLTRLRNTTHRLG
ncbi:EnvZ/OmpR regulon moderator MzrA [uncultured Pluralibacter sp.]|uniref:EnvZ/OmpR regulon moderator MzrA n=1 Tax=uncultured Pluralibacter sp. TaxID=1490864 RepID=UPI00260E1A71|nr:EnvZ/OmpR regulon moderator MzrA [uncultured Pluralibacter sp.]